MKRSHLLKQVFILSLLIFSHNLLSQTFTEQTAIILKGLGNGCSKWGDFDNDGDLDILMIGFNYSTSLETTSIYRNNGNNTFTELTGIGLEAAFAGTAEWGDYNNDGFLDIIISGNFYTGDYTKVYRNNGNSTFTEQTSIVLPGLSFADCAWGDYDNDGDLDILLAGISTSGYISKVYQNNGNNSFTEQTGIKLQGVAYCTATWADTDNDGFLDIFLSGLTGSNQRISKIYHNNGNNTFTELTYVYLAGVFYSASAFGDYDNDGDLDLVITGALTSSRTAVIYRNEGNNLFVQQSGISLLPVSNGAVAWGDCDNDGDLDLIISGYDNSDVTCRIYRNNGNNTFTERTDISITGIEGGSVGWGDYDNDNDLDLLITGKTSTSYVSKIYRCSGLTANTRPLSPTGLSASWENDHLVFRWNRSSDNNTPSSAINYNIRIGTTLGGNQIRSSQSLSNGKLLLADLNCQNNNSLSLKLPLNRYYWSVQAADKSVSGSLFATEQITPTDSIQARNLKAGIRSSTSLAVRWTNGNGSRRALFARISSTASRANPVHGKIYKAEPFFGDGDQIGTTGWFCMYNGKADSVVVYGLGEGYSYDFQTVEYIESGGLPVYFKTVGTGNPGTFSSSLYSLQTGIVLTETYNGKVFWADMNNDGYLDIVLSNHVGSSDASAKIYKNNGNNTFAEQTIASMPAHHYVADVADYDNDSDLDLLLVNNYYTNNEDFRVLMNTGGFSFSLQTAIPIGVAVSAAVSGDYDNDGYLDLLLTGRMSATPVSKIFRNNGNNTFSEQTGIVITGVYEGSAAWGDYNNDGFSDFIINGKTSTTQWTTRIYKNNGNSSFTDQTGIYLNGVYSSSVAWGDYDNDSDLDILLAGSSSSYFLTRIYRNNGDNTFSWQTGISLPAVNQCNVAWGDYNNDGYLDILMTGYSSSYGAISRIYSNSGSNSFSQLSGISLTGESNSDCTWGDYDNDGDLDIIIGSKVYSNNTIMTAGSYPVNVRPVAPITILPVSQPDGMRLSWNSVKGDETKPKALSYNLRIGSAANGDNILPSQSDKTTGYRRIPALGNAQSDTAQIMKLPSGKYYWSVQAVDQAYTGGAWSSEGTFDVKTVQAFFSADEVCLGLATHFTDQSVATDGIASWLWNFRDGSTSSAQSPAHTFAASGTYLIKLVVTSTTGIKDSVENSVIVRSKPLTDFTAPATCQGTSTIITNTTNLNGLSISQWSWNFGDGQTSGVQQPPAHGYINAGNYQVFLKAIASNGCADSITRVAIVAAYPVAEVTTNAPTTFCAGNNVTLSVPYISSYTYAWYVNGTGITGATASQYTASQTGNYSVAVTNPAAACKTNSGSVSVTAQSIPAAPTIITDGPVQFCQGGSVTLSVTNTSGYSYQWRKDGGAVGTNLNSYTASTAGVYSLTVTNATGCAVNAVNTVTVVTNSLPVVGNVSLSGSPEICDGETVTMSVISTPGYLYQWRDMYGYISGATSNSYSADISGSYQLEITSSNNCSALTQAVDITVNPIPVTPTINPGSYQQGECPGDEPLRLEVAQPVTGYSYQWLRNGEPITDGTLTYLEGYLEQADYAVEASLNGCSSKSETFTISYQNAPPKPFIYARGPNVWYLACSDTTAVQYRWYYNGNLLPGADKDHYVANQNLGEYRVSIADDKGCFTMSDPVSIPLTGIDDTGILTGLKIFPNPSPGLFTVEMNNQLFGKLDVEIYNTEGKIIKRLQYVKTSEHFLTQIDLTGHAKGMFIINLILNNYSKTSKIITE